ncbi:MAG: response regulator transcription factor [Bacteroidetes bacterium]|nr:MAG: response regulator transcription factor [Bacteroidota bacterium]
MRIKTILVEDSDIYRKVLSELLSKMDGIELIGKASDFSQAQELLTHNIPDLLLLDVEIGEVTSFELLPFVDSFTRVVFITSHPEYAVKAFEINALDYIVKPVTEARLRESINRLFVNSEQPAAENKSNKLESTQQIMVNKDTQIFMLPLSEISHISALGNYVKIFTIEGKQFVKYGTIKSWMDKLPQEFTQIHRSTIINLSLVSRFEKWTNDTGRAYMKGNNEYLEISRSYFQKLKADLDLKAK